MLNHMKDLDTLQAELEGKAIAFAYVQKLYDDGKVSDEQIGICRLQLFEAARDWTMAVFPNGVSFQE